MLRQNSINSHRGSEIGHFMDFEHLTVWLSAQLMAAHASSHTAHQEMSRKVQSCGACVKMDLARHRCCWKTCRVLALPLEEGEKKTATAGWVERTERMQEQRSSLSPWLPLPHHTPPVPSFLVAGNGACALWPVRNVFLLRPGRPWRSSPSQADRVEPMKQHRHLLPCPSIRLRTPTCAVYREMPHSYLHSFSDLIT